MPVDPVTGESLPYAGDPGAPAGAPPMPPGGPEMPPPGAEGPPMEGADQAQAQMEQIAAQAPAPEGEGFSVKVIQQIADELNQFASEAMGDGIVPEITFEAEGSKWPNPLPANIFVPMVALSELAGQMGAEKHKFDPMEINNDGALRKAAAQIRKMRNDSDFMEQITAEPEAEGEMEEAPPEPGELTEEDEELMAAM